MLRRLVGAPLAAARYVAVSALTAIHRDVIRNLIIEEAGHFLTDIEWRYAQARELVSEVSGFPGLRRITAEDINIGAHLLTGFAVTNNSPAGGSIAWTSLHIVYNGTDNTITDGNTALKYAWWAPATSTTTLQTSNTKPVLGQNDVLVFINNAGTAIIAGQDSNQSLPRAIGDSSVDSGAVINGAILTAAIATGAVTAASGILATGSVTSTALGSGAVGTTALQNGAVTAPILGAGAVSATKLNISNHVFY